MASSTRVDAMARSAPLRAKSPARAGMGWRFSDSRDRAGLPQEAAMANADVAVPRPMRCAIYTRKSSEEGLEQEFNSLDAQREAAEAFILSQRQEGWLALPHSYDDGGFSGVNMERPALRKLMGDITAERIDTVVVYKVDRLSRSLLDFARLMGVFEQHGVSFVSVTQQFN